LPERCTIGCDVQYLPERRSGSKIIFAGTALRRVPAFTTLKTNGQATHHSSTSLRAYVLRAVKTVDTLWQL